MLNHDPVLLAPARIARRLAATLVLTSLAPIAVAAAEIHPEVQAALAWTLPVMDCQQPKLRGRSADIIETGANSATMRIGIDSYKIDRYKRKEKRWLKCVSDYKQGLVKDFSRLKQSAQYGLTQAQADQILGKMALIDATVSKPAETLNIE